jgi:transposase
MSVSPDEERPPAEGRERRRRRFWSRQEKRRIVAETREPGASVSIVARRHDVNANQVFSWRRQFGDEPCSFVPVVVSSEASPPGMPSRNEETAAVAGCVAPAAEVPSGRIEIVLVGGSRIIVDETVNAAALARVLGVLERR